MQRTLTIAVWVCLAALPGAAIAQQSGATSEFIFQSAPFASCHASTIVELHDGTLAAAWFGGTREGSPDVGIWLSRREGKAWTAPAEVANGVQPDGTRFPCWNPVLFQPKTGPLMLFYKVGPNVEKWWGLLRTSADGGKTWSAARRLPDGILGPIKNKPLQLAGGDLLCPSSVEKDKVWRVHFERTSDLGKTWTTATPAAAPDGKEPNAIQPSILVQGRDRLQAVGRTRDFQVFQTWSNDGGRTWTPLSLTGLPNPNSGTDAVTLRDGRHLLVYNHTMARRASLGVALSRDGKAWHNVLSLENDGAGKSEYSYPACIQTRDGKVHITYTWNRTRIKHVVVDPAALPPWKLPPAQKDNLPVAPPGVVIDYSPAWTGLYIGSPSIAVLPNGNYVASHDFFGPLSNENKSARSLVFRSSDRGQTWKKVSEIQGAFWSALFVHRGVLYLLGTDRDYGNLLIRRSNDGGRTWTSPTTAATGLLRGTGGIQSAPTPVTEHNGRLWYGIEWRYRPGDFGCFRAGVASVAVDADLLRASNWTFSDFLPSDRSWNGRDMGGWLEGNAVVTPSGEIVDILRTTTKLTRQKAAIVHISADGKCASFDPATGFVDMPGAGQHKFTIRFDPQTRLYWSLTNACLPEPEGIPSVRNKLALVCSRNLKDWTIRSVLLAHPDRVAHAFQYPDWQFDGDDLIVASRTAYDDGLGGAHDFHDANFLTFHRVRNFRNRTMADTAE
jgi:predicted neuraminidase